MGYYTDFDISKNSKEVQEAIQEVSGYTFYNGLINCKWYGYEEDCLKVSKTFPQELIVVSGQGEEVGDLWVSYFKNGKCQRAKAQITFESFDESKLK